jgi:hypothetical protein
VEVTAGHALEKRPYAICARPSRSERNRLRKSDQVPGKLANKGITLDREEPASGTLVCRSMGTTSVASRTAPVTRKQTAMPTDVSLSANRF